MNYYQTFSSSIEAVSLADVQRVVQERVQGHRLALVVGDMDTIESGLRGLDLPTTQVDHDGRAL